MPPRGLGGSSPLRGTESPLPFGEGRVERLFMAKQAILMVNIRNRDIFRELLSKLPHTYIVYIQSFIDIREFLTLFLLKLFIRARMYVYKVL